jgi:hypothetical protein
LGAVKDYNLDGILGTSNQGQSRRVALQDLAATRACREPTSPCNQFWLNFDFLHAARIEVGEIQYKLCNYYDNVKLG